MVFGSETHQLVNLGASGLKAVHSKMVYGDAAGITDGIIGENLKGDISGLTGEISHFLVGDATGIIMNVTGKHGDLAKIIRRERNAERMRLELAKLEG